MADSRSFVGISPGRFDLCLLTIFPVVVAVDQGAVGRVQFQSRGSARAPATPKAASDGPMPRTITFLGPSPVTMNPPIGTPSPVRTCSRVEILSSLVLNAAENSEVLPAGSVAVAVNAPAAGVPGTCRGRC